MDGSCWFLAKMLPSTFSTLCSKVIRIPVKTRTLPIYKRTDQLSSTYNGRQFMTTSVHFLVEYDERNTARRAGPSAAAESRYLCSWLRCSC